jgi:RNA polymerase sigma factor (sigma-70 family)
MEANFSPDIQMAIQRKAKNLARLIGRMDEEDCSQEICLFLVNRMQSRGVISLEAGVEANTWIRDAASETVERMGRKKRFRPTSEVPFEPHLKCTMPDTDLEDEEEKQLVSAKIREAVDEGIQAANPKEREMLALIYKVGLKQTEVAKLMGRAVSGINKKKQYFEGRILGPLLRRRLGDRCPR